MKTVVLKSGYFWAGIAIFIVNVLLKLWHITTPEIGIDEPFTIFYANADISALWEILPYENNPPLFTLILKAWVSVFDTSPISVRMLPMLFSALSAVVIFRIGREFYTSKVAWLATGIFTFASCHYFYAHEARPYALFVLLAVLSMYAYLKVIVHNSAKHHYWLVLFNVLLIYNHFFGFLLLFVQFAVVIFHGETRRSHLKGLFFGWLATAVLFSPYLPLLFDRFTSSSNGTWVAPPQIDGLYTELWRFSNEPLITVLFLLILSAAAVLYFVRKPRIKIPLPTIVLLVWFLFCFLGMFAVSFKIPIFLDRYLIFISPAFYLLIAIGLFSLIKHRLMHLVAASVLVILMIATVDFAAGNPKKQAALVDDFIVKGQESETIVIVSPEWYHLQIAYYYNRRIFEDYKHTRELLQKEGFRLVNQLDAGVQKEIDSKKYVVFVDSWAALVDPTESVQHYLDANMTQTRVIDSIDGLRVTYYERK